MTTRELTEVEKSLLTALLEMGAFNVRSGSITIHFDHLGDIKQIEIATKRSYPQLAKLTQ